ncbi:MAG: hypothetical protein R3B99_20125 [Polyangiales bacterium]
MTGRYPDNRATLRDGPSTSRRGPHEGVVGDALIISRSCRRSPTPVARSSLPCGGGLRRRLWRPNRLAKRLRLRAFVGDEVAVVAISAGDKP